jgi:hypothetical protein
MLGRKPRRICSLRPFASLSPCAGFEPFVLQVYWSLIPRLHVRREDEGPSWIADSDSPGFKYFMTSRSWDMAQTSAHE